MLMVAIVGGAVCLSGCGGSKPNAGASAVPAPGGLSAPGGVQPGQTGSVPLKPKKNRLGGEEP